MQHPACLDFPVLRATLSKLGASKRKNVGWRLATENSANQNHAQACQETRASVGACCHSNQTEAESTEEIVPQK